jgi:thioredoxin reductase (NADPH)
VNKPVILVVDDDPQVLAAVRRDLRARYRESYMVVSASSGEEALATIRELKARGDALAMLISDQRMPGIQGTEVLTRSRDVYPLARRVMLTAYSDIDAAVTAINEAHLDHYLSKPWDPPEERLFPVVDDLLDSWQAEYLPEATGLRLVGHQWSPQSHAIKDFLAGNLIPYRWLDIERNPDAPVLLDAAGVRADDLPVLVFEDGSVLRSPEPREVAARLGRPLSAAFEVYDLVIVGAGPAGLAAAVYGASEGLRTLLLDRHAPGGQAGSSSRIENYLGFPAGVSGSELTRRAVAQAQRLGAEFLVPVEATGLSIDAGYKRLALGDNREIITRTLLAATGMAYREHPAPGMAEHAGAGVYYGSSSTEAPALAGRRVVVVGGGNSAGQSAMYLSRYAKDVQIVVRGESLRDTMSQYLIDQIAKTPNVRLRAGTEVERVDGTGRVERVAFRSKDDGATQVEEIDAVFVFIGTRPRSDWLPAGVRRDAKGFVLTGRDLLADPAHTKIWKEPREPFSLETSVPGVFAAGDIRAGAMNRVASAVGEGSMVVRLVHEYLALT